MLSVVKSMTLNGLEGYLVEVQTDISGGLPSFDVVGLPDVSVKEAKERIKAAIKNSEVEFPSRKILINLAPADIRKEGSSYDLPMAVGILIALGEIEQSKIEGCVFIGELSLDGKINRVNGILPMCIEALNLNIKTIILPEKNAKEASVVKGIEIIPVKNLKEVVDFFNEKVKIRRIETDIKELLEKNNEYALNFSEVKGQENIKRALEISASRRA